MIISRKPLIRAARAAKFGAAFAVISALSRLGTEEKKRNSKSVRRLTSSLVKNDNRPCNA